MKANRLLKSIYHSHELVERLVRFSGKSWGHVYKWLRDSNESGEPSCLQRTLDLIDLTFIFDPTGARQIAALPMEHYRELVRVQAEANPCGNLFENAFRGLKEATEAGEALTNVCATFEERKRQFADVMVWAEENLARIEAEARHARETAGGVM